MELDDIGFRRDVDAVQLYGRLGQLRPAGVLHEARDGDRGEGANDRAGDHQLDPGKSARSSSPTTVRHPTTNISTDHSRASGASDAPGSKVAPATMASRSILAEGGLPTRTKRLAGA